VECCYEKLHCGGCTGLQQPYPALLAEKYQAVTRLLGKFGPVRPILGAEEPTHYRCKLIASFGTDPQGKLICGLYAQNTHRIIPIRDCLLENPTAAAAVQAVCRCAARLRYTAYDEDRHTGLLRHVLVRYGAVTGQLMVVVVTYPDILPGSKNFVNALRQELPGLTTVVQNINQKDSSAVLGERCKTLFGPGDILDVLCDTRFVISPTAFYQINPAQTEKLYTQAMMAAAIRPGDTVLDAYCGTGTIGLIAAKQGADRVVGVESNRAAIQDAIRNAKKNGILNARFVAADAGSFMRQLAAQNSPAPDVLFMDPPRAGSDAAFLQSVLTLLPGRVVYVSCNPETQARDLKVLTKAYRVEYIQPVDLFPYTCHVETVCLLSKLSDAKHHVEVELNLDEMDLTAAEKKATYQEIKDYVLENSGLKVSTLSIAQVKQKCGIIERENYNLPKKEDYKQPPCPPEKEKAIMDALKHFGMI